MRTKEKILGHTSTTHPFGDRQLEVLIDIRDIHHGVLIELTRVVERLEWVRDNLFDRPIKEA